MNKKIKQKLNREGLRGLAALAELEISRLEESNQQLIAQFDADETAVLEIDENLHEEVGRRYNAIHNLYGYFANNLKSLSQFTDRYRKAREERMTLLIAYNDRRRNLLLSEQ